MQAEYQAMYAGMQEIMWLRGVLGEIRFTQCEPTPSFLDSQSAEELPKNPVYHKRSKHVEIKYHFVREHVDPDGKNAAELIHVSTHEMAADICTKALTGSTQHV
jgi:3-oxoacyl-ACP reductase-like protein